MTRLTACVASFLLVSFLGASTVFGDVMSAAKGVSPAQQRAYPPPPLRVRAVAAAQVITTLEAAAAHEIEKLRLWNEHQSPTRIGIVRDLSSAIHVGDRVTVSSDAPFHWRGAVQVAGASRVRLKLTEIDLPPDAVLWVYGSTGPAIGFDTSLAQGGTLWTPSIDGETITLEVQGVTGKASSFNIVAAVDLRAPAEVAPAGEVCLKDAKCESGLDEFGGAVGHMQYISGTSAYVCSGGLIIESQRTFVPYFLTANHCVSTAAEAASLETFWDYKAASCNGNAPPLSTLPRTHGSVVLATDAPMDVSLLRLSSVPSGTRYFLGWSSAAVSAGTTLYRISHPHGQPQRFSMADVETTSLPCTNTPRTRFIYSKPTYGTVAGGSSGSPAVLGDGKIVGQLSGGCPGTADPCGADIRTSDGSFSAAYPNLLKPFLDPGAPVQCGPCVPTANTACMLNGRFKVTMTWKDPSAGLSGSGRLINYADNKPVTDPTNGEISQVTFWSMYAGDPNSVEALVRIIRGINSFWIFTTGFAAAEYTVTVQDTGKCTTWQRTSAFGATEKIADYTGLPF